MLGDKLRQLILTCVVLPVHGYAVADDFQRWMQQQAEGVQQQKQTFQKYKDERDRDFTDFLKTQWKAVEILKAEAHDLAPKPDVIPVAPPVPALEPFPETLDKEPTQELRLPVIKPPAFEPEPEPDKPVSHSSSEAGKSLNIEFFGTPITLSYDVSMAKSLNQKIDKAAISDYWSSTSRTDYDSLVKQLENWRSKLKLNDWAYVLLVNKVAHKINDNRRNEASILSWFLLIKSSYKARVAYDQETIYLLLPSQHEMYDELYFTFGDIRYYVIEADDVRVNPGRVFTYDGEYPNASRVLDMHVTSDVATGNDAQRRHLSFQFDGKNYNIEAVYDRDRIRFFETYPQLDLGLYFGSGVYRMTATPMQQQLLESMRGMSELQAVNFLLRFVQTSLQYETDDQQFGRENYLFPEETIFYPYSDCEDRAVLFAWLVSSLLGLDVVGLDYPGHVAAAVHFTGMVNGDSVSYKGKRYVVTDPTYVNARAGMSMPQFKKFAPTVVDY